MSIGRTPDAPIFLDDVTVSRNHALLVRRREGLYIDDLGSLNGTYVNRKRIESHLLERRRRDPDRQVQARLPGALSESRPPSDRVAAAPAPGPAPQRRLASRPRKALTIGAVCKILRPGVRRHLDLEDPLPGGPEAARSAPHPRRLPPLQPGRRRAAARDPAHAARRVPAAQGDPPGARRRQDRRRARSRQARGGEPATRTGARGARRVGQAGRACSSRPAPTPELIRELEEFGIVQPRAASTARRSSTRPTSRSSAPRPSWRGSGSHGRNLRVFRTSADREAALIEQILGPVAALAQPGAARGGAREPRGARRHLHAAQAPAARPRPAPAARLSARRPDSVDADRRRSRSLRGRPPRAWRLLADPDNLPRWWPETDARRVASRARPGARPQPLHPGLGDRARARPVRADYRCTAATRASGSSGSSRSRAPRSRSSCARAVLEVRVGEDEGEERSRVTIEARRRCAASRVSAAPMMRRATKRTLEAALDGIERALVAGPGTEPAT